MKLRIKLVLIAAGLTLLGLSVGLGATYWSLLNLRLADLDSENRLLAQVIMGASLGSAQYEVPEVVESYLTRGSVVSAAQVYRRGQLIWESGPTGVPRPLDPRGVVEGNGIRSVGAWRVYTLESGEVEVQVGRSLAALQATMRPYATIALPLVLALSFFSGVMAWVMAGLALHPLETLTRAARDFDSLAELPPIPGRDEAATLAAGFAVLLEQLRHKQERELRFLAYAAHELRTPISALRASLEAARARQEPPGPELLVRLHREALRLETFAQNLLALSRAESQELRAATLDLADLAEATYDRLQPLALEAGHELVLEAEPAPARGDPRLLEQALNNLVANAVRHTPKGKIALRSGAEGEHGFLEVADQGPGFPEPMAEGLGLRVARAVARAHGGNLEVAYDGGSRVRLWLSSETGLWQAPVAPGPPGGVERRSGPRLGPQAR
ncbi:MAG: HAMP domain-containing histidine kinase, partial [Deinococcota bacterium]|nr:HAMP domain-containing histidine kinase [Deinococcota bacterium]